MNKKYDIQKIFSEYGIYLALIAICVGFALASKVFLTTKNILNIARQVSMVGIAATGFIFVLLQGGIDLSIGSQITLANIIMGYVISKMGITNLLIVFPVGITVHLLSGVINGLLITKVKILPLVVTLSTMTILDGISWIICRGQPFSGFPPNVRVVGQGYLGNIPIPVIIMALMFCICAVMVNTTYIGRFFFAVGGNKEASNLSGINVDRITRLGYILSAGAASIAGIVMLSRTNSAQPGVAKGFEFDVITASVLGGVSMSGGAGRVSGLIAGVLIIGVLNNGLVLINLDPYMQLVIKGLVLLAAVGYDSLSKDRASRRKMVVEAADETAA